MNIGANLKPLVDKMNDVQDYISTAKTKIANAITSMGVTASAEDSYDTLASKIQQLGRNSKLVTIIPSSTVTSSVSINIPEGCNQFIIAFAWANNYGSGNAEISGLTDCDYTKIMSYASSDSGEGGGGGCCYLCTRKNNARTAITLSATISYNFGTKTGKYTVVGALTE